MNPDAVASARIEELLSIAKGSQVGKSPSESFAMSMSVSFGCSMSMRATSKSSAALEVLAAM